MVRSLAAQADCAYRCAPNRIPGANVAVRAGREDETALNPTSRPVSKGHKSERLDVAVHRSPVHLPVTQRRQPVAAGCCGDDQTAGRPHECCAGRSELCDLPRRGERRRGRRGWRGRRGRRRRRGRCGRRGRRGRRRVHLHLFLRFVLPLSLRLVLGLAVGIRALWGVESHHVPSMRWPHDPHVLFHLVCIEHRAPFPTLRTVGARSCAHDSA